MNDAYREHRQHVETRESIRKRARELIGLHAGDISRLENQYRDYSTIPGFDTAARSLAGEYPEWFGHEDHAEKLWDLLRGGKQEVLPKLSPELINAAAEVVRAHRAAARQRKREAPEDDTSFDFGANARFAKQVTAFNRAIYSAQKRSVVSI
jgi:hypothetical protein